MRFLTKKSVIIWVVLIWVIAQFLVGIDVYLGERGNPDMRHILGLRVIILAGISYLFYNNNKVARWLFMIYVGLMGIGGIGLGLLEISAGQFDYLLPVTFAISAYFIYSAGYIYRYY